MAIRTFIALLPYLLLWAHASHTNTSAASSPSGIYMEGGGIAEVESHMVKKRILPTLPPPPPALPSSNGTGAASPGHNSTRETTLDKPQSVANITSTSTASPPSNSSGTHQNALDSLPKVVASLPPLNKSEATSTTSSSSSTSTTTTTTTTTTTPKPKKPTVTVALDDDQTIVHVPSVKTGSGSGADRMAHPHMPSSLDVEEPIAQLSMEQPVRSRTSRDLVIPVVSLIFAVPMILGLLTVVMRRFRDYWQTRHYRRMDFLVDGIYND